MTTFWQQALAKIKEEVRETSFEQWFSPATVIRVEKQGDTVYLCVNDEYAKNAIETLYMKMLTETLCEVLGEAVFPVIIDLSTESIPAISPVAAARRGVPAAAPVFNPRYTFDSFVVGSSNRFSHAASMAVAESPSRSYNPLFIYGGSGLGKTHLMHAIGQAVLKKTPGKKVVYVSSEAFTNEFISMLRENRLDHFKARYRNTDILLIDDIQFLTEKDRIQEEFFHTFNALHDAGRQIVISSDRPPKEISPLEERLRSRFEWGLITDIQPPDWETRCAILQRKALSEHISIDNDVVALIADKIKTNIRELEGALNKVIYSCELNKTNHADMAFAKEVLKDLLAMDDLPKLSNSLVQKIVADYFAVTVEELKSKKKDRIITHPRQIAMYFCREAVGTTTPQIGRDFGGRDHTTVMYACEKISTARKTNSQLDHDLNEIEKILLGKA
ncbi:MAG: chromosomal replication initiator protein DnaA [Clostridia bacterium]|nr:chromosomal replication initiator protein DnaA [Clostridia bacterium]